MKMMRPQLWILMIGIGLVSVCAEQYQHRQDDISDSHLHKDRGQGPLLKPEPNTRTASPYEFPRSSLFDPEATTSRPIPVKYSAVMPPSWCTPRPTIKLNFSSYSMPMVRFNEDVVKNADVISLNMSHNLIKHVSADAFVNLPMLEILDLSANRIPVEEMLHLKNLGRLEMLFLNENTGSRDGGSLVTTDGAVLHKLRHLHLRGNGIREFTVPLKEFSPHLTSLCLSNNKISSTEFFADLPQSLTYLNLDDNSISRVQSDYFPSIHELSMNRNELEVLCLNDCNEEDSLKLESMKRLLNLRLSGNKIKRIVLGDSNESWKHHSSILHLLDLSHNELSEIPKNFIQSLRALKNLALGYNQFTEVPNLCGLRALQILDLSGNGIKTVPAGSFCDIGLHQLNLSKNKIMAIEPKAFTTGGRWLDLDLSGNQLSSLPYSWIDGPEFLKILRLQNNTIADLRAVNLARMGSLQELYITGNPVTHLVVNSLNSLPPTLRLYFHDEHGCNSAIDIEDDDDNISD